MSSVVVPLTPSTNQTFDITLPVDSGNIKLTLAFTYNSQGQYWFMSITQAGQLLLDGIPLLAGAYPAGNILRQYAYLGIGSAYIVPATSTAWDSPNFDDLGTDFVLVWSDTP